MTIVARGNQFCAMSEDGTRSFGCFSTRELADKRLREVEFFKSQSSALSFPTVSSETIELGDTYEKDLIYTGNFKHPVTGEIIPVDHDRIDKWVSAFNKMNGNGVSVPFIDGHGHKARDVYGHLIGMRRDGDKCIGKFSVEDDEARKKIGKGIREVSVGIKHVVDGKGNDYGEAIFHVAATPYPVIPGQDNFVRLSDDSDAVEVIQLSYHVKEETNVNELLKALGVKDEKEGLEKLTSLSTEVEGLKEKIKLSDDEEAEAKKKEEEAKKKKADEKGEGEGEGEGAEELSAMKKEIEELKNDKRKTKLDLAMTQGKIKPDQFEQYLSLMATEEGEKAVDGILEAIPATEETTTLTNVESSSEDKEVKAELAAVRELDSDEE